MQILVIIITKYLDQTHEPKHYAYRLRTPMCNKNAPPSAHWHAQSVRAVFDLMYLIVTMKSVLLITKLLIRMANSPVYFYLLVLLE